MKRGAGQLPMTNSQESLNRQAAALANNPQLMAALQQQQQQQQASQQQGYNASPGGLANAQQQRQQAAALQQLMFMQRQAALSQQQQQSVAQHQARQRMPSAASQHLFNPSQVATQLQQHQQSNSHVQQQAQIMASPHLLNAQLASGVNTPNFSPSLIPGRLPPQQAQQPHLNMSPQNYPNMLNASANLNLNVLASSASGLGNTSGLNSSNTSPPILGQSSTTNISPNNNSSVLQQQSHFNRSMAAAAVAAAGGLPPHQLQQHLSSSVTSSAQPQVQSQGTAGRHQQASAVLALQRMAQQIIGQIAKVDEALKKPNIDPTERQSLMSYKAKFEFDLQSLRNAATGNTLNTLQQGGGGATLSSSSSASNLPLQVNAPPPAAPTAMSGQRPTIPFKINVTQSGIKIKKGPSPIVPAPISSQKAPSIRANLPIGPPIFPPCPQFTKSLFDAGTYSVFDPPALSDQNSSSSSSTPYKPPSRIEKRPREALFPEAVADIPKKKRVTSLMKRLENRFGHLDELHPEMEDYLFDLADDFIDQLSYKACVVAKHRKGTFLKVKDLQLELGTAQFDVAYLASKPELIPGFSDEIRGFRKPSTQAVHVTRMTLVNKGRRDDAVRWAALTDQKKIHAAQNLEEDDASWIPVEEEDSQDPGNIVDEN